MRATRRRVLVLNQFALPRSAAGGTRHVELFERLDGWEPTVLTGRRAPLDQSARAIQDGRSYSQGSQREPGSTPDAVPHAWFEIRPQG